MGPMILFAQKNSLRRAGPDTEHREELLPVHSSLPRSDSFGIGLKAHLPWRNARCHVWINLKCFVEVWWKQVPRLLLGRRIEHLQSANQQQQRNSRRNQQ